MENAPFFSILVPTYNQCQYLEEALDSLLNQTDSDWEAIIVNDGSTDLTAKVLEIYSQKDSRFQVIHKKNGGVGSALNIALKQAKGEWICWLSSDDLFEPNKLEIHRQWISKNSEYKFFFSNFQQLVGTSGKVINQNPNLSQRIPPIQFQIIEMLQRNFVAGNSICVMREAWINTGYFNEELKYAQDYDMWIRLMLKNQALFIPEYTYLQRIYPEQESQKFSDFCLYDSAKSSLQILNNYSVQSLLPLINLESSDQIDLVIKTICKVAFDRSSFIYQLGFHPLLILKIQQLINQYNSDPKKASSKFQKRIDKTIKIYRNMPEEFWCRFSKRLVSEVPNILNEVFLLSFEQLGESYYHWLNYIDSDLQDSVLTYFERFCNYKIYIERRSDEFAFLSQKLLCFQDFEIQTQYIKLINTTQEKSITYSSFDKIYILEKNDLSLKHIRNKIFAQYGRVIGLLFIIWIYILRFYRLFWQGTLSTKLQGYITYITNASKFDKNKT